MLVKGPLLCPFSQDVKQVSDVQSVYVKFQLKIPNRSFFTACLNCHFLGLRKMRCFSVCPLNANELLLHAQGAELHELALSLRTISSHGMMIISETLSNGVHFESDNNAYRVRVLYRDGTGIV